MEPATPLNIVILAAGKSTRMRSSIPKVLHPLCGVPLLERCLRAVVPLSPARVVVVVGHGAELVEQALAALKNELRFSGLNIETALQSEQRGTGHAARVALERLPKGDSRVLILPGDAPLITSRELAKLQAQQAAVSFLTARMPEPGGLGRVVRGPAGEVLRIVEAKDCTPEERGIKEINASIYLASRSFLDEALASLKTDNAQGEYYLTDIVSYAVTKGAAVTAVEAADSSSVLGANSRVELQQLEAIRRHAINCRWMEDGVTMEDPSSTYIDEDVQLSPDCYLGAGTRLKGGTMLEEGVVVEGDSFIRDCRLGSGVRIKLGCYLEEAAVAAGSDVGPFAHLRPGTRLAENVRIGNFVEVKNSQLAPGVKANHLSYLGDSQIGAESNIGAGTITCNYDGVHKHKTVIGTGCFIGSNTALVAPVAVGDGAYVGAGSTITRDVPGKALGIARAQQRNIDGWAEKKKKARE